MLPSLKVLLTLLIPYELIVSFDASSNVIFIKLPKLLLAWFESELLIDTSDTTNFESTISFFYKITPGFESRPKLPAFTFVYFF